MVTRHWIWDQRYCDCDSHEKILSIIYNRPRMLDEENVPESETLCSTFSVFNQIQELEEECVNVWRTSVSEKWKVPEKSLVLVRASGQNWYVLKHLIKYYTCKTWLWISFVLLLKLNKPSKYFVTYQKRWYYAKFQIKTWCLPKICPAKVHWTCNFDPSNGSKEIMDWPGRKVERSWHAKTDTLSSHQR